MNPRVVKLREEREKNVAKIMEMMFGDTTGFESIFGGLFGTDTDATENGKPPFAFTPDGNLTLIDDFLQVEVPGDKETEQIEKQFITVQSKNGKHTCEFFLGDLNRESRYDNNRETLEFKEILAKLTK